MLEREGTRAQTAVTMGSGAIIFFRLCQAERSQGGGAVDAGGGVFGHARL